MSIDDVKVHYNSENQAKLDAEAFSNGNEIHISDWHVIDDKEKVRRKKKIDHIESSACILPQEKGDENTD